MTARIVDPAVRAQHPQLAWAERQARQRAYRLAVGPNAPAQRRAAYTHAYAEWQATHDALAAAATADTDQLHMFDGVP